MLGQDLGDVDPTYHHRSKALGTVNAKTVRLRVRTGCTTCKRRRVKCDEGKPVCQRCERGGHNCEGYAIPAAWLFNPDESRDERRRFQYLVRNVLPSSEMYSASDYNLWCRLTLQVYHTSKAMKHGCLAMQAFHEGLIDMEHSLMHQQYAQSQYVKALRETAISRCTPGARTMGETVLMTIVLRQIEVFRNDFDSASIHLRAGKSILEEARKAGVRSDLLEDTLTPIMERIHFQAATPIALQSLLKGTSQHDSLERTIRKARAAFQIICCILQDGAISIDVEFESIPHQILTIMRPWRANFLQITGREDLFGPDHAQLLYAELSMLVSMIALATLPAKFETLYDSEIPSFELVMDKCEKFSLANDQRREKLVQIGKRPERYRSSYGVEIASILFYVATKCREPKIRRRAIALMLRSYRRGLKWESYHAAAIAQWVLASEEAGCRIEHASDIPQDSRYTITGINYYHKARKCPGATFADPAQAFGRPTLAEVKYSIGSDDTVRTQWFNFISDLRPMTEPHLLPFPPIEDLILSYRVDDPPMPPVALMFVLAYRKGLATRQAAILTSKYAKRSGLHCEDVDETSGIRREYWELLNSFRLFEENESLRSRHQVQSLQCDVPG